MIIIASIRFWNYQPLHVFFLKCSPFSSRSSVWFSKCVYHNWLSLSWQHRNRHSSKEKTSRYKKNLRLEIHFQNLTHVCVAWEERWCGKSPTCDLLINIQSGCAGMMPMGERNKRAHMHTSALPTRRSWHKGPGMKCEHSGWHLFNNERTLRRI